MNDLTMAEHDDACEDLRAAWEAEQYETWATAKSEEADAVDEDAYREWLEDNDLTDSPANRDAYGDHLSDEWEARYGA